MPLMNKAQRKTVDEIVNELPGFEADIARLRDELQEYYDNRSEAWQDSDRGTEFESMISLVDEAVTAIENATSNLEEARDAEG